MGFSLGCELSFESAPASYGVRALRLDFAGGRNLGLTEPAQYVPVEPSRVYHFHAYMRTAEITTESGMRFSIIDPNHGNAVDAQTENFTGSHPWTTLDIDVTTGPETHFLLVRLLREDSRLFDNKLRGSVWIADVSLVPTQAQGTPRNESDPRWPAVSIRVFRLRFRCGRSLGRIAFGDRSFDPSDLLGRNGIKDKQPAIRWSPLNWPLLGFIAVGIAQLVFRWTPNPFLTRLELLRLAAYFIVFFLLAQAFRERPDFVKLAWFLLALGFSVALLGIIQHFTSEGTIYWFRQLAEGGEVFGPYVNRNHFSGFVELVAPVAFRC